ncbi:MAG: hypothetical protein AVDCRST_MAG02-3848 [uncultured Rubrobacteraceae bacterium]|uniref:Uncharacterized protein n=1 Tax=uncultured Rubrobacteraceae bacterium TaxID=349277 RepID=A0A6J4RLZ4_9ACTN|nr:MAG: hypothetical protein AVDCRST_MAG02-3848 [uncultured Rubrobacteraceae bacterium]
MAVLRVPGALPARQVPTLPDPRRPGIQNPLARRRQRPSAAWQHAWRGGRISRKNVPIGSCAVSYATGMVPGTSGTGPSPPRVRPMFFLWPGCRNITPVVARPSRQAATRAYPPSAGPRRGPPTPCSILYGPATA